MKQIMAIHKLLIFTLLLISSFAIIDRTYYKYLGMIINLSVFRPGHHLNQVANPPRLPNQTLKDPHHLNPLVATAQTPPTTTRLRHTVQ